jgi:UMP-CMP kinase
VGRCRRETSFAARSGGALQLLKSLKKPGHFLEHFVGRPRGVDFTQKSFIFEVTCSLLENAMVANKDVTNCFLIDGFPRNKDNLDGWQRQMSTKTDVKFTLFFDCTEEICTERCLQRGMAGSGRADDNMESLKKRFVTYKESSMPIINHFEDKGLLRKIDATRSPDEVFEEVARLFEALQKL